MKNKIAFVALVAVSFLFTSCGKEKGPENNSNKVKSYSEEISSNYGSYSMTYNLSYDGNNRITAITPVSTPEGRFSFKYPSKDSYSMELYNSGELELRMDFFLRNSKLDSTTQYNSSKDTMSGKYYYDAGNLLIRKIEFEHNSGPHITNSIQYTYDASGNMIKSTDSDRNVETFEYYPDLVYLMPAIAPFFNTEKKMSLTKSYKLTRNGRELESTETSYTFDSRDRISTIKEAASDGTNGTKSFTYF